MKRYEWYSLFCGDGGTSIDKNNVLKVSSIKSLFTQQSYAYIQKVLGTTDIVFLQQIHGIDGIVVNDGKNVTPFVTEGDFLITNKLRIGLGVLTADCLPIICFDNCTKSVGIAHAGWKGSIGGVVSSMIAAMKKHYNSVLSDIKFIFGPCARVCCYEVGNDFVARFESEKKGVDFSEVIEKRGEKLFLNIPLLNERQLSALGVCSTSIDYQYNECTICNTQYCSYRRDSGTSYRNITVVSLK